MSLAIHYPGGVVFIPPGRIEVGRTLQNSMGEYLLLWHPATVDDRHLEVILISGSKATVAQALADIVNAIKDKKPLISLQ